VANAHRFYVPVGVVRLAAPPDAPVIGETYFDTALGQLRSWDGIVWVGTSSDTDLDTQFLNVPGDAMTGELALPDQVVVPPSTSAAVAAKGYVDQLVTISRELPIVAPVRDGLVWVVTEQGAFTVPSDIPGLGLWLEADSIPGAVDGMPITAWFDRSAIGYKVLPDPSAPTWHAAGVNGLPSVYFNGSQRMIIKGWGTALTGKSEYTVFIVGSSQNMNAWPTLLGAPTYAGWQFLMQYSNTGDIVWGHPSGQFWQYDTFYVSDQVSLMTFHLSAGLPKFYKDSVQVTYAEGPGFTGAVPDIGADVNFGQYWDGSTGLVGHVSAVLWYDRALTDVERQQIENYLRSKYGILIGEDSGERA
jgi:hypothetical protein